MNALVIFLAVFLVVKIFQWRELLSIHLPQTRFTAREPEESSPVVAPLFAARELELANLGFSPLIRSHTEFTPPIQLSSDEARLYLSSDQKILALVTVGFSFFGSSAATVHFLSRSGDGTFYETERLEEINFLNNLGENQFVNGDDLEEYYNAHRELVSGRPLENWPAGEGTLELLNAAAAAQFQENLRRKLVHRWPDGSFSLTLRGLWRFNRAKKPDNRARLTADVPTARLALFHWIFLDQRRRYFHLSQSAEWGFFAFTALLSLVAGGLYFGPRLAVIIFLVILIHEGGHWLTMRLLGYRKVHMIFLPLIGGLAFGEDERPSAVDRAWTFIMGPLPGILLALALSLFFMYFPGAAISLGLSGQTVGSLIDALLFINLFNLLPIIPLDGGQLLRALLPRSLMLSIIFCLISCGLIGWAIVADKNPFLVPILLALVFMMRGLWQQRRCLQHWYEEGKASPLQDFHRALTIVRKEFPKKKELNWQVQLAQELVKTVRLEPMGWRARLFFIGLWLGCFLAVYGFFEYLDHFIALKKAAGQ